MEGERLAEREVAVEERVMADEADPPPDPPRLAGQLRVEDADGARARAKERREDPQQRRLAGAVRAEDGERGATPEAQRYIAEHRPLVELAGEAVDGDRGARRGVVFGPSWLGGEAGRQALARLSQPPLARGCD